MCSKECTNGRLAAQLHSWDSSWRIYNHGTKQGGHKAARQQRSGVCSKELTYGGLAAQLRWKSADRPTSITCKHDAHRSKAANVRGVQ